MPRKNLKEARQRAGMTQKHIAEYLGMTERAYQRIENGERLGTIETWDLLEDLFNTTLQLLKKSNAQGTFRSIISLQTNPYERE